MFKKDLIDFVASETNSTNGSAEAAIDAVLSGIIHGLKSDQKVTLRSFGIFEVQLVAGFEFFFFLCFIKAAGRLSYSPEEEYILI